MNKEKRFVIDIPDLMIEWDWEKNNQIGKYPDSITYGHNKSVYWKCAKCGHGWEASPNNRTNGKTGCPCCAGKVVVAGINDLQTRYPEIAKKWHPTKNKKKPCEVTAFSNSYAWWICDKDSRHVFRERIDHMTKGEVICSICSNQKIIIGVNDFQTTNPELMKEWDWAKNNDLGILPTKITRGYGKNVHWKCIECGHEWPAIVASRTGQHTGCPKCKKDLRISVPEKAIAYYLAKVFQVEENKQFAWLGQSEIDIYVDELKLGVEYDGKAWHKDVKKDIKKDELCNDNGIFLIRVREKGCPHYESPSLKIVRKSISLKELGKCIQEIFDYITEKYGITIVSGIDIDNDYIEILSKVSTSKKEKSIATTELLQYWDFKKNGNISPETISLFSHKEVYWKCKDCGNEWKDKVSVMSKKKKPYCEYCSNRKLLTGFNDLETLNPELAKEWDYCKNTKKPSEVKYNDSIEKYMWICSKCGRSYPSSVYDRNTRNRGCPDCGREKTIVSHYKKVINKTTNEIYISVKEASERTGVNPSSISNCCRGKRKTAGGFVWKFVKED